MRTQMLCSRILLFVMWLLSLFGLFPRSKVQDLRTQLKDMKDMFDTLVKIPDEFNSFFAERGWIAYERMNIEVMRDCVSLAKQDKLEEAEEKLVRYYNEEHITWGITWAITHPAFMDRWEQMHEQVLEDYKAGRYYSCIPLVLIIIDGAVQDVDKNHGLASDGCDVQAWDSIAGHSSGLAAIKSIYTRTRNKTNREAIDMPYRNGILHGRDLNYGNKKLAAKCWGILFATADWAFAKQSEEKRKADLEAEQNPPSLGETLAGYGKHRDRMAEVNQAQDAWGPRTITPGINIPLSGQSSEYGEDTPERASVEFLEWWQARNYGHMARATVYSMEADFGRRAGLYRESFGGKSLQGYEILQVSDQGSGVSEVTLRLKLGPEDESVSIEHTFRLLYWDDEGNALPRNTKQGRWKIVEQFSDIATAGHGAG